MLARATRWDNPRRIHQILWPCAALFWLFLGEGGLLTGTGQVRAVDTQPASGKKESIDAAQPRPKRDTEKQIKAYSGLIALMGIVIAGVGLVSLVVIWAGRLRRQIRKPLPDAEVSLRDFWFLKPPKPTVTRSSLPEVNSSSSQDPPASDQPLP